MAARSHTIAPLGRDPAYERAIHDRRRALVEELRMQADRDERVLLALGWANWELSTAIAPAPTRWVLGYRTWDDLEAFGRAAEYAGRALDVADHTLDAMPETRERAVAARHERWRNTRTALRRFADVYKALSGALPEADADLAGAQETCRQAAVALSELREDEDADTAAAARLWQAILLEAGDRGERNLATLDLSLATPKRLPYDFFLRVLRCEMLVQRGSYAIADGLAMRMQKRCDRWFSADDAKAAAARATLAGLRAACLWQWADAIHAAEPDQAAALQQEADALVKDRFGGDGDTGIYMLQPAVPIFVGLPSEAAQPPTTAPARQRTTDTGPLTRDD